MLEMKAGRLWLGGQEVPAPRLCFASCVVFDAGTELATEESTTLAECALPILAGGGRLWVLRGDRAPGVIPLLEKTFNTVLSWDMETRLKVSSSVGELLQRYFQEGSLEESPEGIIWHHRMSLACGIDLVDNCEYGTVRASSIHGLGLFANQPIETGTVLIQLDGQRLPLDEIPYSRVQSIEWNAVEGRCLLVRSHPTKYGFINHSRQPNAVVDTRNRQVIASCFVPAGQEILLDYRQEPLPTEYFSANGSLYL